MSPALFRVGMSAVVDEGLINRESRIGGATDIATGNRRWRIRLFVQGDVLLMATCRGDWPTSFFGGALAV